MRERDDDDESGSTLLVMAGVLAGVVVGVVVAERLGGWRGVGRLFRKRRRGILSVIGAALPAGTIPAVLQASGILDLFTGDDPPRRRRRRRSRPSRDLDELEVDEFERAAAGLPAADEESEDTIDEGDETADEVDESDDESMEALETRVLEAFNDDPVLRGRAIEIAADDDGWVELSGRVHHRSEARLARDVARSVDGVRGVTGVLSVRAVRRPPAPTRHSAPDVGVSND